MSETTPALEPYDRRVAVIFGGISTEHEVSVKSGTGLVGALEDLGAEVLPVLIERDGTWTARGVRGLPAVLELLASVDAVIPALHGEGGEDGTVQGLLETAGITYVGSRTGASGLAMDKWWSKAVVASIGGRITPGLMLDTRDVDEYRREPAALTGRLAAEGINFPVFVKPNRGGSSIGVTRVEDPAGLPAAVETAAEDGSAVLIETEIRGREIDIAVLEMPDGRLEIGPPLEILSDPNQPFFDFTAKYASGDTRFEVPARIDADLNAALAENAGRIFRALGVRGLARIDFFVDENGPVFNEINTFPGMTAKSQFPNIWAARGLDYPGIARILVETAIARP
ncbi:D-alanine--D-alanine ligase family protein [Mycetocola spongiae]|uniref:D-alanine--D-alanine ligase family protein n=1 Tax=Mycetocola spongiae TaxID=2859226 RepID=UPI001CF3F9AC|nr:D-alanine--D-alanine ligase family protein [Mycetocola spongiae]UCR88680.1 D-alanine--D-alanine ligase [Mycetocola spongiae]